MQGLELRGVGAMKRQRSTDATTVVKLEQDVVVVEARPTPRSVKRRESRDFVIEEGGAGVDREVESSKGGSENGRVHCKDGEESVAIESSEGGRKGVSSLVGTKRTNAKREEDEKVAAAMEAAAATASSEREEGELEPEGDAADDTTNGEKEGENTVVVAKAEPMKEVDLPVDVEVDKSSKEPPIVACVETTQFDLHLRVEEEKKVKEGEEEGNSSQGFRNNPSPDKFFTKLGRDRERERVETGKEDEETRQTEKKQRVEDGAHLSLALLDTSLSLSSCDIHSRPQKQRRSHSQPSQQAPSHSRAFTDSLSLSHSLPFHHNPSCSLTQTSMDKTELSSGSQQLSYGSWQKSQSKSKPLYQKILQGSNPQILQGSLGRAHNAESSQVPVPFRPSSQSEHARRRKHRHGEPGEVWSSPSRSGDSRENSKGGEKEFTSIGVQDIVSEPIPSMARKLQELPDSFLAGLKENLREMLNSIEKREQFVHLQQTLGARKDLSTDVLLRAHRIQLELLVAVKTGILAFLHSDIPMTHSALVEVFLQQRCRNFVCQNQLPADECDCKLCAQKAGFCNSCMCVVCSKFDFDANTCRWIGCDFCLHWCHTDCGIRMSYITPGPSIRGAAGTTEMQFNCVACGHTSELYGFVKDVFCTCAPEWGRDVLARELDCVRRIFHGSTDTRGKQLCSKAEVILQQLNSQVDTAVACRSMVKFFDESSSHGATPDQSQASPVTAEPATKKQVTPLQTVSNNNKQQQTTLEMAKEALATYDSELEQKRQEANELQQERERKKAQIEELESIVRIKQAEAKMFALRADEARREAEGLHRIMLAKADKIEQEYTGKLSKLGIDDAENRCRKHRETVQVLQQAQMDFHAMNLPLLNELHELLKQLEASKRHSWK